MMINLTIPALVCSMCINAFFLLKAPDDKVLQCPDATQGEKLAAIYQTGSDISCAYVIHRGTVPKMRKGGVRTAQRNSVAN